MPDPTQLVISSGFAAALGVFVVFAVVRELGSKGMGAEGVAGSGKVSVEIYEPRDLVGVAFVFLVFSGLVLSALSRPPSGNLELEAGDLWVNIGFQFLMAGVVTILVIQRIRISDWLGLRWNRWPWVMVIGPASVLLMWAIFGGLHWSGYVEWMESLGVQTVQDTVKLLQKERDPVVLGLMAFAAVIAAPLCEEVVFRGYVYPVLKKFSGACPAAVASSLVFACAHGSLTALLPLFLFGLLLVVVFEKTGSLWAPIAVHFCFNGATVAVQLVGRLNELQVEPPM